MNLSDQETRLMLVNADPAKNGNREFIEIPDGLHAHESKWRLRENVAANDDSPQQKWFGSTEHSTHIPRYQLAIKLSLVAKYRDRLLRNLN